MIFFGKEETKTREDKRMVRLYLFIVQNSPFGAYILRKSTHSLFDAWSILSVPHSVYT